MKEWGVPSIGQNTFLLRGDISTYAAANSCNEIALFPTPFYAHSVLKPINR
jgi:hypothetical protein